MPPMPVPVPDDIDLTARDFEGFRRLMLESLALDNPEREKWSEADLDVALTELLAAGLDRLSHATDALFAEHFLVTANWPRSVVRHLTMIDGVAPALDALRGILRQDELDRFGFDAPGSASGSPAGRLFAVLDTHPQLIDMAKAAALADVNRIESLISLEDLRLRLAGVPLVAQVAVRYLSEGGTGVYEAALLFLDSSWRSYSRIGDLGDAGEDFVDYFKSARDRLCLPDMRGLSAGSVLDDLTDDDIRDTTVRTAVSYLLSPLLPLSTRLRLIDGARAGVFMRLCVIVNDAYFRSEVEMAVRAVLSAGPEGFFRQSNFSFGQALYLSDLQEALTALDGVDGVIVNRLQLVGTPDSEATASGVLRPPPNRALTLDADNSAPNSGYFALKLQGGVFG